MNEYGKLNGVPIDPGEGWEIVPKEEARFFYGADMRASYCYTVSADVWILTNAPNWSSNILAFRRPKTVQAGRGESGAGSFNMEMHMATCIHHSDQERKWNRCPVCEVKSLNAKLAAQSVALEKAEDAIQPAYEKLCQLKMSHPHLVSLPMLDALKESLTLITAAKEVGK